MLKIFPIEYFIGLVLIGIFAGFISGLLGVGGGFLIVPLQYFLLESVGVSSSLALLTSLGTSLAIIIPTASSGAYRHSKVLKNIFKPGVKLGIFGIIGGVMGGIIVSYLPVNIIKIIFGIFLIFIAIYNFLTVNNDKSETRLSFNIFNIAIVGLIVGLLSGILGIGGGLFIILALTLLFGYSLIQSIGISSVFISSTAIGGTLSYIYTGWNIDTLPYSLGYVSILNLLIIGMFSIPLAYYGAKVAHKIPAKTLKKIFAILVFCIGLKMLF